MFKKFIKFIKSIFSIEESSTFKENIKSEYHFKVQLTDAGAYFTYVPGPIPEQGEVGTMYLINKYSGIQLWDGEKYLPVANGGTGATTAKEVVVTELPLIGDPNTVYVIAGDGYRETYIWSSLSSCFILTEDRSNEIQEPVYS